MTNEKDKFWPRLCWTLIFTVILLTAVGVLADSASKEKLAAHQTSNGQKT